MKLTAVLLLIALQASESRLPVTIRCEIDTELPVSEIKVSLEEKREVSEIPKAREEGGGTVTLSELPPGDLHLLFFRDTSLLGKVRVPSTEEGEFIRVVVRVVEGNAILLDEFRVRGVSEMVASGQEPRSSKEKPEPRSVEIYPPSQPSERSKTSSPSHCPGAGEPLTLRGKLVRIIDNDSFELQSGPWNYIIYVGTATRIRRGRTNMRLDEIPANQSLTVHGTVAAGPEGECSVGAKSVEVTR